MNAKRKPAYLSCALAVLASLASACGGDDSDKKRAAAQMGWVDGGSGQLDLSGQWVSNDFTCGAARLREFVSIEQYERDVTGVKVTGDDCIPAGYVSFEGQLPRTGLTYLDLPVRFPIHGYSGQEGRPETIAVTASGEALVVAPDVLQLVFSNVSVRLVRSEEDPTAPAPAEPTSASGSPGRSRTPADEPGDAGVQDDEQPTADAGSRRGRSTTGSSVRADAGARDAGDEAATGGEADEGADASDAAVEDAGPDTTTDCPNPFLPGASCDHLAQCGCAEDENCRFDGLDPPSCFPAGPMAEREPCEMPSDCAVGLTCAYDVCVRMCESAADCERGSCVEASLNDVDVDGLSFCVEQCDPVVPNTCYEMPTLVGSACEPCGSNRMCTPQAELALCTATGNVILRDPGAACTDTSQCFAAQCYGGTCQPWCRTNIDCPGFDGTCVINPDLFVDLGDPIGHCTGPVTSGP